MVQTGVIADFVTDSEGEENGRPLFDIVSPFSQLPFG